MENNAVPTDAVVVAAPVHSGFIAMRILTVYLPVPRNAKVRSAVPMVAAVRAECAEMTNFAKTVIAKSFGVVTTS